MDRSPATSRSSPACPVGRPVGPLGGRWVWGLLLLLVTAHLVAFGYVTIQRVVYPFELEWMEGALVDHTSRILRGEDIYTAPSVDHISYLYTPLYYYVSAAVASVTGLGFLPLRLVAVVASLGCAGLLGWMVARDSDRHRLGSAMVAGGFFIAGFWVVDGWHDLARNDSLFLLLILATVGLLRGNTNRRAWIAGAVVTLAFLAKQLTLVLLPPLAIAMAALSFRRAMWFTISTTVCLGLTVALYTWLTDPWFWFFVFDLPARHAWVEVSFWSDDMRPLWISLAIAVWFVVTGLGCAARRVTIFYGSVVGGLLAATYIARHHTGGHINALMPWLIGGGLAMGLSTSRLPDRLPDRLPVLKAALLLAICLQFGVMFDSPRLFLPSAAHRREFTKLQNYLEGVEGEVLVPCHGHLAESVGKPGSMHGMAMHDLQASQTEEYKVFLRSLGAAWAQRRYQLIVIDEPQSYVFFPTGEKVIPGYRRVERPPFDHRALSPLHGLLTTPALVFERQD